MTRRIIRWAPPRASTPWSDDSGFVRVPTRNARLRRH